MRILAKNWPAPPRMTQKEYRRYQSVLLIHVVLWIFFVAVGCYFWGEISLFLKIPLMMVGCVFSPNVDMLENIFLTYDAYSEKGLW